MSIHHLSPGGRRAALFTALIAMAGVALVLWAPARAAQQADRQDDSAAKQAMHRDESGEMNLVRPDQLQWKDGPESLPKGIQHAVLEGDPTASGPFTMRLKAPANYRIPPHTHPKVERVTVLSGHLRLGMGRAFDETKMQDFPAGGFFTMPPGMEHFAMTKEETVIQLNGMGPWQINYLNPEDDPRKKK